jgi:ribosomal protein S27E
MFFKLSGSKQKFPVNFSTDPVFNISRAVTKRVMRAQNSKVSGASTLVLDQQLQCVQCLQMKTKFS